MPIALVGFGFSTAGAVALSNITILGGTLVNLAFNVGRMHPLRPGAPIISWDLAVVMEPSTILGAVAGGYVNRLLPPWATNTALAVLLLFLTSRCAVVVRRALPPPRGRAHGVPAASPGWLCARGMSGARSSSTGAPSSRLSQR